jgi:hypothetical protein
LLAEMRYEFRTELGEASEPRDAFVRRMTAWLDAHFPPIPGQTDHGQSDHGQSDHGRTGHGPQPDSLGVANPWRGWLSIGEPSGEPVGHVFLHLVEKVPNPLPENELIGYVTNLYVVPSARGLGVGAALLDRATSECRDLGCDSAVLWPSPRSVRLYERHGYRRPARVMELELAGHPGAGPTALPLT